jgi:Electron transfer DM13/Bacterial Ig-like domain (group 2)
MRQLFQTFTLFMVLLLNSCVGTDLIDDPIIGERIRLSPRIDSLTVGKEQIFSIKFTNKYGIEELAKNIVFRSSDPSKISVDATGKAKAIALGRTTIYVTNGVATDSLVLNKQSDVGSNTNSNDTTFIKRGVFKTISSSYSTEGNVRLQTVKGVTQIVVEADFKASPGPSVYLLLTNHTDGRYTVTPGSNAVNTVSAQITPNKLTKFSGAETWTVPAGVNPADYKFVVLYCVLGPVFGAAELK